jgi:hypothetical protein
MTAITSVLILLAQAEPSSTTRVEEPPAFTTIDLDAKGMTVAKAVETVAAAMGFAAVLDPDGALADKTVARKFEKKPAWEALVDLLEEADATWGPGDIGEDQALKVFPTKGRRYTYVVRGGLAARFSQSAVGTESPNPMRLPASLWIRPEPRLAWRFTEAAIADQRDPGGKACDALGLDLFSGRPQLRAGKDGASPWRGLSAFTAKTKLELVKKAVAVEVTKLAVGAARHEAKHGGKEALTLESLANDGRFVVLAFSLPSGVQAESVAQGGWGSPVEDNFYSVAQILGEMVDADGRRVSPTVLSLKGDGKRLTATMKFAPHKLEQAGGLAKLRLRVWIPTETSASDVAFEFKDLAGE